MLCLSLARCSAISSLPSSTNSSSTSSSSIGPTVNQQQASHRIASKDPQTRKLCKNPTFFCPTSLMLFDNFLTLRQLRKLEILPQNYPKSTNLMLLFLYLGLFSSSPLFLVSFAIQFFHRGLCVFLYSRSSSFFLSDLSLLVTTSLYWFLSFALGYQVMNDER